MPSRRRRLEDVRTARPALYARGMNTNQTPAGKAMARSFLKIAMVEGAVLVSAVVLLSLDVIPFGVFIAVVAVCVAASGIAILRVSQRHRPKPDGGTAEPAASAGPGSTIDPANPFTR